MTATVVIQLINQSKHLQNADVHACADALDVQVNRDFAPVWGAGATVISGPALLPGAWPVYLRDSIDAPGALGDHSDPVGRPTAIVDIDLCLRYGLAWTVTASHEVLEMRGDPTCNLVMPYPNGRHVAYEACDPVEADKLGYEIDGVLVSDFITLEWFHGPAKGGRYDFTGHLRKPFQLAAGGYISVERAGKWTQIFKEPAPGITSRRGMSRRHMHRLGLG